MFFLELNCFTLYQLLHINLHRYPWVPYRLSGWKHMSFRMISMVNHWKLTHWTPKCGALHLETAGEVEPWSNIPLDGWTKWTNTNSRYPKWLVESLMFNIWNCMIPRLHHLLKLRNIFEFILILLCGAFNMSFAKLFLKGFVFYSDSSFKLKPSAVKPRLSDSEEWHGRCGWYSMGGLQRPTSKGIGWRPNFPPGPSDSQIALRWVFFKGQLLVGKSHASILDSHVTRCRKGNQCKDSKASKLTC